MAESALRSGVKFSLLGLFSFVLTLILTALFHEQINFLEEISYLFAIIVVFFVNFFIARNFVFQATGEKILSQLFKFLLSSLAFRGAEYLVFLLLHSVFGIHYLFASASVMIVSFIGKFFFYKVAVFNQK